MQSITNPRPDSDASNLVTAILLVLLLFALVVYWTDRGPCPDGVCPVEVRSTLAEAAAELLQLDKLLERNAEQPPVDLPEPLRERNWGGGSCVHASTVMCLRQQGLEERADWWRKTYSGGESLSGLVSKLERAGLRYAYVGGRDADADFLDWCTRNRRWAVIFFYPNHSICFCGYSSDGRTALLLDNNRIGRYIEVPRDEFLRAWRGYGGVALTPIYSPIPPDPYVAR